MKLDDKNTIYIHKNLIKTKFILKKIYEKFYNQFKVTKIPPGKIVELGSGGGFLKEMIPKVITSDVVAGPNIDHVFSATNMPFKNNSLSAIFMLNVFHHIKNPAKALQEMERCLKPKGKIVMIEPYNTIWSKFIYQNFHHETFDPYSDWKVKGKGRLTDANDALPWIVFVRDRKKFEEEFKNLKIKKITLHTSFLYILSGGLSKPQLIPNFIFPFFEYIEKNMGILSKLSAMFATIELEKIN